MIMGEEGGLPTAGVGPGASGGLSRLNDGASPREVRMAQRDYTPHQEKIIKRYYNNLDTIALHRLAEQVGELYLSEGKKRQRVWEKIASDLKKLGLSDTRIAHVRQQDNPALVAEIVKELQAKK